MNTIKENLIKKIQAGEITMVPRWQFVLRTMLGVLGVLIVAVLAVYFLSFVLFTLNQSGLLFAPMFGWSGVMLFVMASPWFIILLIGLFLVVLYILVSQYAFSYRQPLVYSLVGVVLVVVAVASLIHQSNMHERMRGFMERHEVPGMSPLYRGSLDERPEGVVAGEVITVAADNLILQTTDGRLITVEIQEQTKLPRQLEIVAGSQVMVFGKPTPDGIEAFGIRPYQEGRVAPMERGLKPLR